MAILVINAGSSSLKFSLFEGEDNPARGAIDRLGAEGKPHFSAKDAEGKTLRNEIVEARDHDAALSLLLAFLKHQLPAQTITAVGHRVVHGGDRFTQPVELNDEVIRYLESLVPLAPLHQPHALVPIKALAKLDANLPQIACFDTAFHATQSPLERRYALPRAYFDKGVKKYGFHGLSYEYIASQLPDIDASASSGRTVVFHLGNGASMCALRAGRSVAGSMGFTALEGLMMGTRTGSIDPGVLLYLAQEEKLSPDQMADLLYKRSGLLGVSEISSDMRDLLESSDPRAEEAVELFCHRAACELGRMAAILEGLDAIVFTAGIGEHAAPIRQRICEKASWLGVRMDADANRAHALRLHESGSKVGVFVVPTNEERMIARHVRQFGDNATGAKS